MHIGFICHEYPPCNHGGIGSFTKDLAEALVFRGHKVTVIGYYTSNVLSIDTQIDETINSVRVIRYPLKKQFKSIPINTMWYRWKIYNKIKKLHKKNNFDLIESPGGSGWLPFGLPSDIPLVTRLHGGEVYTAFQLDKKIPKLIKVLERMQLEKSIKIVSVSNYTANTIFNLLNINKKYEVMYNSVNNRIFKNNNKQNKIKKGLILFVGTLKKAKGVEELAKAMNIICKEDENAHLVFAGKITEQKNSKKLPYKDYLLSLVDETYRDRILFTGTLERVTELIPLMQSSEICCFPSYVESFSLVPLEAMSLGKAVVFTKLTSGPEAIEDGVSGLLCDPKDPKDIANKILLLLKDKALRDKLAINGKNRVLEKFTFKTWIDQNIAMYHEVAGLKK